MNPTESNKDWANKMTAKIQDSNNTKYHVQKLDRSSYAYKENKSHTGLNFRNMRDEVFDFKSRQQQIINIECPVTHQKSKSFISNTQPTSEQQTLKQKNIENHNKSCITTTSESKIRIAPMTLNSWFNPMKSKKLANPRTDSQPKYPTENIYTENIYNKQQRTALRSEDPTCKKFSTTFTKMYKENSLGNAKRCQQATLSRINKLESKVAEKSKEREKLQEVEKNRLVQLLLEREKLVKIAGVQMEMQGRVTNAAIIIQKWARGFISRRAVHKVYIYIYINIYIYCR